MRFVFLIPVLDRSLMESLRDALRNKPVTHRLFSGKSYLRTKNMHGGTLNLIRHCALVRNLGTDAVLATITGGGEHNDAWGIIRLPTIAWKDRQPDDICVVPDFSSWIIDEHDGPCIVYQQHPDRIYTDFDHQRENVRIWTDSPPMLEECRQAFPGKDIPIAPNIIDHRAFPFIEQKDRTPGDLIAFPRKGPEFIEETMRRYRDRGGNYWKLTLIDGLPFRELAKRFEKPQAFLASADIEGAALPPQESMAGGVVVIGRDANGANFAMQDGTTALVGNTPEEAADALLRAEDADTRDRIARTGFKYIERFFDYSEPTQFWNEVLESYAGESLQSA